MGLKRYTVLTYIFGGYEKVHEIEVKDPDADYVLITDNPELTSDTWQVRQLQVGRMSAFGKCYTVRFHPFDYISTDIVVRIDGSIGVKQSLRPLVDEFERGQYDRCIMIHPHRNTMPEEYQVWVDSRRYPEEQASKCLRMMARMSSPDYVKTYKGLYQGCFEIQRNNEVNRQINDMTFGLLCLLGKGAIERIDQTVTSFVMNRFYNDRLKIMPVAEDIITDGNLMQWYFHNSENIIPNKKDRIEPYLFNKLLSNEQVYLLRQKGIHSSLDKYTKTGQSSIPQKSTTK